MKKQVTDYVKSLGGTTRYSGRRKIMYIRGCKEDIWEIIIAKFGYSIPLKFILNEIILIYSNPFSELHGYNKNIKMKTVKEFKKGDAVRYIPTHAEGNASHKDCENGVVNSVGYTMVFVRYYRNGMLQHTAEATDPNDLIYFS